MKQDIKKVLNETLSEATTVVNKNDLTQKDENGQSNWSAEYQVNKKLGKKPYLRNGFILTPVEKGSDLKKALYIKEEDAVKLSNLGKGIQDLINTYDTMRHEMGVFTPDEKRKMNSDAADNRER